MDSARGQKAKARSPSPTAMREPHRREPSPLPHPSQHRPDTPGSEGACGGPKARENEDCLNPHRPRSERRSKAPRSRTASPPPPHAPPQPQQPAAAPPSLCLRHGRAARSSRIFFFMKRLRKRNHLPLSSRRRKDAFNESLQLALRGSARGFGGWGEVTFAFKSLFHR